MKKFITAIPLQQRLSPMRYQAMDNPRFAFPEETCFPILPLIHGYVQEGEKIGVVPILIDNPAAIKNYEIFQEELRRLSQKQGFEFHLDPVKKADNESTDTVVGLFARLIEKMEDGDTLFACVTFGTKPVSTVTTMALHYAHKAKENAQVEAVVYGLKDHADPSGNRGELYDMTSLFYIDSLVDRLTSLHCSDVGAALKLLLESEG